MLNKIIYFKELKHHRTSFLVWCVSFIFLIMLDMVFYPILMKDDMLKQMSALMENPFMKGLLSAFGATLDVITNVLGYYAARNTMFILLLGSFFSILLAGKILSQEEHEKTAEFLLSKPVTRTEVVWSKLAAFLSLLLVLNIIILITGYISLEIFKGDSEYSIAAYLIHTLYCFLMMLTFAAVGLFLSLWIKRGRPTTNISIGIIIGGYFIDAASKITPALDKIGYLSPFKFVDSSVLNPDFGLEWWRLLYFLGTALLLFALSLFFYKKKDILI
ncbi:MAG: ABC transporter permease [Candidatus Aminicenantes bacterium]|nr:ABC transporter permease [Candidatus Aminicenantes bacterium]